MVRKKAETAEKYSPRGERGGGSNLIRREARHWNLWPSFCFYRPSRGHVEYILFHKTTIKGSHTPRRDRHCPPTLYFQATSNPHTSDMTSVHMNGTFIIEIPPLLWNLGHAYPFPPDRLAVSSPAQLPLSRNMGFNLEDVLACPPALRPDLPCPPCLYKCQLGRDGTHLPEPWG